MIAWGILGALLIGAGYVVYREIRAAPLVDDQERPLPGPIPEYTPSVDELRDRIIWAHYREQAILHAAWRERMEQRVLH